MSGQLVEELLTARQRIAELEAECNVLLEAIEEMKVDHTYRIAELEAEVERLKAGALRVAQHEIDWTQKYGDENRELRAEVERLRGELRGYHVQQGWAPPAEGDSDE